MKKIPAILLTMAVHLVFAEKAAEYFPLSANSRWIFHVDTLEEKYRPATCTVTIAGTDVIGGKEFYRRISRMVPDDPNLQVWTGSAYASWYRAETNGIVWGAGTADGANTSIDSASVFTTPLPSFPDSCLTVGYAWNYDLSGGGYSMQMRCTTLTSMTVTVPAGTFTNCLRVKEALYLDAANIMQENVRYYSKGVGEVLTESWQPYWKQHRWVLLSASVQATSAATGISQGRAIDRRILSLSSGNLRFRLDSPGQVRIVISDLRGSAVRVIMNAYLNTGEHVLDISTVKNLPKNVYIVQLHLGNHSESVKWSRLVH